MSNHVNFFIPITPFQLFNCIEAKNRFHKKEKNILFYQSKCNLNTQQMNQIIDASEWDEVIFYPVTITRNLFFFFYLRLIIYKYKLKTHNCYYGNCNTVISYLINSLQSVNNILVDDGLGTIDSARKIYKKKVIKNKLSSMLKNKIKCLSKDHLYISQYFTVYSQIEAISGKNIILNDYRCYKKKIHSMKVDKTLYFMGTPLVYNCMPAKLFEKNLKKVVDYYKDQKLDFIYVMHRYEDLNYMKNLSKKINFKYVCFENIVEVEFFVRKKLPLNVASFTSTAAESLYRIYSSNVLFFEININSFFKLKRMEYANLYKYFKEENHMLKKI